MRSGPSTRGLRIKRPSAARAVSFAALRDACLAANARDDQWKGPHALAHDDPVAYAAILCDWAAGRNVPDGLVSADTFWVLRGDEVVAECDVRHRLTPKLRDFGGHIGYVVHPAHRNGGVATFALRECLKVLADLGESEALLTCDASNVASARVIEKCGGYRIEDSTTGRLRYRIPLSWPDSPER